MDKKINLLIIADGVTPTGFSNVMHNIVKGLSKEDYNIKWLAVNHYGDPHPYDIEMYPASNKGDIYGLNRLADFSNWAEEIFILNDAWIIDQYLKKIKDVWDRKIPPIVVYIPVDAKFHDKDWYSNFDIVTKVVAYTKFGKDEIFTASKIEGIETISHGADTKSFYQIYPDRQKAKADLYPNDRDDLLNSFIVLSANRNQPRKKLEVSMEGFKLFAEDKPLNVKLYMHCGLSDMSITIDRLADRLGIGDRLIITNTERGVQKVDIKTLNLIYNSTDVGITTSLGEGFGLTAVEHALTGAPQLVPDSSACSELWWDCGLLIPAKIDYLQDQIMTVGKLIVPEDVANCLEDVYTDKTLYDALALKAKEKFSSDEYNWTNISKRFDKILKESA